MSDPSSWTTDQLCVWLEEQSFLYAEYVPTLKEREVNGSKMLTLLQDVNELESQTGIKAVDARFIKLKLTMLKRTMSQKSKPELVVNADAGTDASKLAATPSVQSPVSSQGAPSRSESNLDLHPHADVPPPDPAVQAPSTWSVAQVASWLESQSFLFAEYVPRFKDKEVDGVALLDLDQDDLIDELQVSRTDARFILIKVASMKKQASLNQAKHAQQAIEAMQEVKSKPKKTIIMPVPDEGLSEDSMADEDDEVEKTTIDTAAGDEDKGQDKKNADSNAIDWGEWDFGEGIADKAHPMLVKGGMFLKYGRSGFKPHRKYVCVNNEKKLIVWASTQEEAFLLRDGLKKNSSHMDLNKVRQVVLGKHTQVFKRKMASSAPFEASFSLIGTDRTLDLRVLPLFAPEFLHRLCSYQAEDTKVATQWVIELQKWLGVTAMTDRLTTSTAGVVME